MEENVTVNCACQGKTVLKLKLPLNTNFVAIREKISKSTIDFPYTFSIDGIELISDDEALLTLADFKDDIKKWIIQLIPNIDVSKKKEEPRDILNHFKTKETYKSNSIPTMIQNLYEEEKKSPSIVNDQQQKEEIEEDPTKETEQQNLKFFAEIGICRIKTRMLAYSNFISKE